MPPASHADRRLIVVTLVFYSCLLFALLPLQSLWLDEVLTLFAVPSSSLTQLVFGYAAHAAGQSPLGWIEQWLVVHAFGYSPFTGRLPAALAGILACLGTFCLARAAGVQRTLSAVLLFASFPLILRYGTEARPYSQAVCVAVWLTFLFLRANNWRRTPFVVLYTVLLVIGVYTQPYVLSVAVAHLSYALLRQRSIAWHIAAAICLAGLIYLPWYLHCRDFWKQEVAAEQLHFHLQGKLVLVILRELFGTGYLGTAFVLSLSLFSWKDEARSFWLLTISLPVLAIVAADTIFDYFFAIRQIIFILPMLAVTAALGLDRLPKRQSDIVLSILLALNAGYAVHWFTKPRENWAASAGTLMSHVTSSTCISAIPFDSLRYYAFFQPELTRHQCNAADFAQKQSILVAVSPYATDDQNRLGNADLRAHGFVEGHTVSLDKPVVKTYVHLNSQSYF